MKPLRLAFFDTKPYDRAFFDEVNKQALLEVTYFEPHLTIKTSALAHGYDAVCAFVNDTLDAPVLNDLYEQGTKLVALRCAGYNNVDLQTAYKKLHVVRVPEYSPNAVAEHTVALMMALNRKTHRAYYRTRDMNFSINGLLGFDMYGKSAGVIGTGKIGRIVIRILKGFGMHVVAFDPFPQESFAQELGFEYVGLEELYGQADILTLHCPLTPENVHMINKDSIHKMKPGVMIINTGRGKLINTRDLIYGLKNHHIGAAGLDVYEEETDYFFEDTSNQIISDDTLARLMTFPNVLVTSHQAFFTREALTNIANTTLNNIVSYFDKGELVNEVCYHCPGNVCERRAKGKCF
jgi:D-lactate dehydrogenase